MNAYVKRENWGSERVSNSPRVTQPVGGKARITMKMRFTSERCFRFKP